MDRPCRVPKLTMYHDTVVLARTAGGAIVVEMLDGFECPPQFVEEEIQRVSAKIASQFPQVLQLSKPIHNLRDEIETRCKAAVLTKECMSQKEAYALGSKILGSKKADLCYGNREQLKTLEKTLAWHMDARQIFSIASVIVDKQQCYWQTGQDSDIVKLTYAEVASLFPDASESTTRRLVKDIRFRLGNRAIHAIHLMRQTYDPDEGWGTTPEIRSLIALHNKSPQTGAPTLRKELLKEGFKISRRKVGYILEKLKSNPALSMARLEAML